METELKMRFARDEQRLAFWVDSWVQSLVLPDSSQITTMLSRYYDTAGRLLTRNMASLRIRKENDRRIATIKLNQAKNHDLGLHQRHEWSVDLDGDVEGDGDSFIDNPEQGLDAAWFMRSASSDGDPDDPLRSLLQEIDGQALDEICQADFTRESCDIGYGDSLMELAFDQGELQAGGLSEPIAELEIELKEGDVRDLIDLGNDLRSRFDMIPESRSKYARCLDLLRQMQAAEPDAR